MIPKRNRVQMSRHEIDSRKHRHNYRHLFRNIKQDYDSSSEEEDLESDSILGKRALCFVGLPIL
jgi:hypothetical protein